MLLQKEVRPLQILVPTIQDRAWQDELTERWTVEWEDGGVEFRFSIPRGYTFQPSIPTPFKGIVPPEQVRLAAAMHDWGYANRGDVGAEVRLDEEWKRLERPLTRREVDRGMVIVAQKVAATINERYGEEVASIAPWRLLLVFVFIVAFGWFLWDDWPERLGWA